MSIENIVAMGTKLGELQPDLKPWQRIDWPLCTQSRIFKDWGQYYTQRLCNKKALQSFGRSLQASKAAVLEPSYISTPRLDASMIREAYTTLDKRSRCLRAMAQPEEAFVDSEQAQMLMANEGFHSSSVILAKCDALFDCNRFEDNLYLLHAEERKFQGRSIKDRFKLHQNRTLAVLEESLGSSLNPFLLENWPFITDLARQRRESVAFMPRPFWQQLRENQHCDVESVIYRKKVSLPPLERARRRMAENVYTFHYMGNSANDVALLRQLRNDKNFLNPFYLDSTPHMSEFSAEQFKIVRKFMKMMHARKPLYPIREKNREKYLYRVEYQTRRDCYRILRDVRRLRQEGDIDRLTDYVEEAMSKTIETKTHRTLPWKYEFINEVYNMLALAHIDQRGVPTNVDFLDIKNHSILYMLPKDRMRDLSISNEFGGFNIYAEIDKDEERLVRASLKIGKLQERLRHSRYAIEKAYLLFEIARSHLMEGHFDKCSTLARRAVNEARSCNNIIWRFNSTFLICQVHASFNRFERLNESLVKATRLAQKLKNPKLLAYLALCLTINDYALDYHRNRQPEFTAGRTQRKRKGRYSQSSADLEMFGNI